MGFPSKDTDFRPTGSGNLSLIAEPGFAPKPNVTAETDKGGSNPREDVGHDVTKERQTVVALCVKNNPYQERPVTGPLQSR